MWVFARSAVALGGILSDVLGPVCRGCYRVPFAGIGAFEVNRTIVHLLESFSHPDSRPMLQAKCALCKLDDTISVRAIPHCFDLFSVHLARSVSTAAKRSAVNAGGNTTTNSVGMSTWNYAKPKKKPRNSSRKKVENERSSPRLRPYGGLLASEDSMQNHRDNVRQSNEIATSIREKVTDLIDRIKDEERKLLRNVEEFQTVEQR